jgi:RNA polymerase sigma-70 factor (ECF subfamily)
MASTDITVPLDVVAPELEFSQWVGALVRSHRGALVRAAMAEGLLAQEALDAVQDAFATFIQRREWRGLPRDTDDAPTGNAEVDTAWRQLDELMVEAEEHLKLTGCIATLKEVQRTIVTARFFEGASGLEVADEMGITPGNVAVILHRAREQLRGCLESSREHFGLAPRRG